MVHCTHPIIKLLNVEEVWLLQVDVEGICMGLLVSL